MFYTVRLNSLVVTILVTYLDQLHDLFDERIAPLPSDTSALLVRTFPALIVSFGHGAEASSVLTAGRWSGIRILSELVEVKSYAPILLYRRRFASAH